jgi:hypothetical protein
MIEDRILKKFLNFKLKGNIQTEEQEQDGNSRLGNMPQKRKNWSKLRMSFRKTEKGS